ncbi:DUF6412 domain-containing protein [Nocardia stercoris]|uniref:Uncharacterized protein n=1 Tax=Nocardia stercoris TaxID=2483361 RepID=A0A3M2L5K0_9NOCA|nr:DUF6412 domain-containing protein [Nocardia stercoris]RMI32972.1 hypothetical protein EBN03_11330 [Nocardia stercoris]
MDTRIRSTAVLLCALVVSVWAAVALSAGEPNSLLAVGTAAVLALAAVAAQAAHRRPVPARVRTGLPVSAQQRRGSYLRQSNPDTAGRTRPRAPGGCA